MVTTMTGTSGVTQWMHGEVNKGEVWCKKKEMKMLGANGCREKRK